MTIPDAEQDFTSAEDFLKSYTPKNILDANVGPQDTETFLNSYKPEEKKPVKEKVVAVEQAPPIVAKQEPITVKDSFPFDPSKIKLGPYDIVGGDPRNQTYEDYAKEHPTEWVKTAQRLYQEADTPEKQQQVEQFIASKGSPELPVSGLAGQVWQTSMEGPMAAWGVLDKAGELVKMRQENAVQRQQYNEKIDKLADQFVKRPSWANKVTKEDFILANPKEEEQNDIVNFGIGFSKSLLGLADFFGSPTAALTGGMAAIPNETSKFVPVIKQLVSAGFAVDMARALPDQTIQLLREVNKPSGERDWATIGELLTSLTSTTAFSAMAAKHASEILNTKSIFDTKQESLSKKLARELAKDKAFNPKFEDPTLPPEALRESGKGVQGPTVDVPRMFNTVEEFKKSFERASKPPEPPVQAPAAEPTQAQPPPAKQAPRLIPALLVNGVPVIGGNSHQEIANNYAGENKAAVLDALADDSKHVFVRLDSEGNVAGKILNRKKAWTASGRKGQGRLHSEDLAQDQAVEQQVQEAKQQVEAAAPAVNQPEWVRPTTIGMKERRALEGRAEDAINLIPNEGEKQKKIDLLNKIKKNHAQVRNEFEEAQTTGDKYRAQIEMVEYENELRRLAGEKEVDDKRPITPEDQAKSALWHESKAKQVEEKLKNGEEITADDRLSWKISGRDESLLPKKTEAAPAEEVVVESAKPAEQAEAAKTEKPKQERLDENQLASFKDNWVDLNRLSDLELELLKNNAEQFGKHEDHVSELINEEIQKRKGSESGFKVTDEAVKPEKPKTEAAPVEIQNIDDIISAGGGKVKVIVDKKEIPFDKFGVVIDEFNDATVPYVELTDKTMARKGLGKAAYIALGEALSKRGITLKSSGSLLNEGQKLWASLARDGYAKKTSGGFEFTIKKPAESAAEQIPVEIKPETQKLSYDEFKVKYMDAFNGLMKYKPEEYGSKLFAEKLGKLQDEYPEFTQQIENEEPGKPPAVAPTAAPIVEDNAIESLITSPESKSIKAAAVKKMAEQKGITLKAMQEQIEAQVVRMADRVVNGTVLSPSQKFDHLVNIYNSHPKFSARTSESIADQAYSTPVPLSYALNHAIDSFGKDTYEATAGNASLMIGDSHINSHANEKNPARVKELRNAGIGTVTENDATTFVPQKKFTNIKVNAPFGPMRNQINYKGFSIKRLEHLISVKALEAMKDDGKAYLIMGAMLHTEKTGQGAQRIFENYVYSHYNVVSNFEVDGSLYSNQGAAYPVRVMVIDGRRKTPLKMAEYSPKSVVRLKTWKEIFDQSERIRNDIESRRNAVVSGESSGIPVSGKTGVVKTKNVTRPAVESGKPAGEVSAGGKLPGGGISEQKLGGKPTAGGVAEPAKRPAVRQEDAGKAAGTAGGAELYAGGLEGGVERGAKPAADEPGGGIGGSEEPGPGIVHKPISRIESELETADIDSIIAEAKNAAIPAVEISVPEPKPVEKPKTAKAVDKEFEKILKLKGVINRGNFLYQIPENLWTTERAIKLKVGASSKREEQSQRYRVSTIGEVSGDYNRSDAKDIAIIDEGSRKKSRETLPKAEKPVIKTAEQEANDNTRDLAKGEPVIPIKSATDFIRDAAKQGVSGIDSSIKALDALFGGGGGVGSMGIIFNEKTYAAAKPHFEQAWKQFKAAGTSLKDFAKLMFERYKAPVEPYLKKFLEEKKSEPKIEDPKEPPVVKDTEHQVAYEPTSKGFRFGTLIPKSIAAGVHAYFAELKTRVGDIDEYVSKKIEMPIEQLFKVMSAEQIDGVAQAIDQIERGYATIIGDQTGIGKGRQAAAIIRYALKKEVIPVFFTKDPKLFSDMYGDLTDIYDADGMMDLKKLIKPLIFGNVEKATIVDREGTEIHVAPYKQLQDMHMENILQNGMEKSGFNAIFSTYSQINRRVSGRKKTEEQPIAGVAEKLSRQVFLERLAAENPTIVIMDEAHEASGDGDISMQAAFFTGGTVEKGSGNKRTKTTVPGLLNAAGTKLERGGGVLYLSATYAKRAENTPVYFRTSLHKAADNFKQIVTAMEKGGVALQSLVSQTLSGEGQYIRREREFTNVSYDMDRIKVADEADLIDKVDQVTDSLQQIVEFSEKIQEFVETSTAMSENSIDAQNFASIVHNQIGQLLLSAKADAVVNKVIEAHKKGEKPVIALMNTMESFLDKYVEENNIQTGQVAQLRWNELLKYALSRTLRTSEKTPNGQKIISQIKLEDLTPELQEEYSAVLDAASAIETDFPVSPIDYIIQKLEKEGIKVGTRAFKVVELTGRKSRIVYTDFGKGIGAYQKFKKLDKNEIVNGFNDGKYDGILLNASGSTGLSIHASSVFKDKSPRHMIIVQPAADINVFVQTLGRIFRTGIVMTGIDAQGRPYGARYSHMVLPLQAELRPAAMAARKMKSLNANTTAEADSAIKIEAEDVMNKYGDAIVTDYLDQNDYLQRRLNLPIEHKEDGTPEVKSDIAKKFTGRMSRMSDSEQKAAYDEIIPAYKELIKQLKASGEYDLEVVMHDDWDGVKTSETLLASGTDPNSLFTSDINLQTWEISDKRHVPSGAEMVAEAKKNLVSTSDVLNKFNSFKEQETESRRLKIQDYESRLNDPNLTDLDKSKIQKNIDVTTKVLDRFENSTAPAVENLISRAVGRVIRLVNNKTGDSWDGTLVNIRYPKEGRTAASGFRFTFMVDAPGGVYYLNGADKWVIEQSDTKFSQLSGGIRNQRFERYIVAGNPIKAYSITDGKGKVVRFRTREGQVASGLLMPNNWSPKDLANDPRVELINGKAVASFIEKSPKATESITSGGIVKIESNKYQGTEISTSAAKKTGGKIYLNDKLISIVGDFYKSGNKMVARMKREDIEKVADIVRSITGAPFKPEGGRPEANAESVKTANDAAKVKKEEISVGPGAASPGYEFGGGGTATSLRNAVIDERRIQYGFPAAIQPLRRENPMVWDYAMSLIDRVPETQDNLISELRANPRATQDFENSLLLHRVIDIQSYYGKLTRDLAQHYEQGNHDSVNFMKGEVAKISDELFALYELIKSVGTETARGLNSLKMFANEAYELVTMEFQLRAENGGRELNEEEHIKLNELHGKIKDLQDDFNEANRINEEKIAKLEFEKAIAEMKAKANPPIDSKTKSLLDRINAARASIRAGAMERIKQRRREGRVSAGLDPTDLADHALIGADIILDGIEEIGAWSSEMIKTFGDYIKPHLDEIYKISKLKEKEIIKNLVSPVDEKRAVTAVKQEGKKRAEKKQKISDRDKILSKIAKKFDSTSSNAFEDIGRYVNQLARMFVEEGIEDRDELVDAVHEELVAINPNITRRESMDAISGYGKFKKLPKDAISVMLRDLKGQLQQIAKLMDYKSGIPASKTGVEKRTQSEEERYLIKLVNNMKREFQIPITDPETQLKSSLDTLKARMQAKITDLQRRIDEGDYSEKEKRVIQMDKAASEIHIQLTKKINEFNEMKMKARIANRTTPEKIMGAFGETVNTTRAIMTSYDLSAVLRQGAFTVVAHPIRAIKILPAMWDAMKSEDGQIRSEEEIMNRPNHAMYVRSKLFIAKRGQTLSQMEEAYMSRHADKIWGVAASQRAYSTFLNRLRADSFDALAATLTNDGELTLAQARAISSFTNNATGRGDIPGLEKSMAGLNTVFFAPKYVASRFYMLSGIAMLKGPKECRKAFAKEYARTLIGIGILYGLANLAGCGLTFNPYSSDFGKIKVGKTRIDPLAGISQVTVLLARVFGGYTTSIDGKTTSIRQTFHPFPIEGVSDKVPYGKDNAGDIVMNFGRSKLAPWLGANWNYWSGEDMNHKKTEFGNEMIGLVVPLVASDIYAAMKEQGVPAGAAIGLLSVLGMGVSTYNDKTTLKEDLLSIPSRMMGETNDYPVINYNKDYPLGVPKSKLAE